MNIQPDLLALSPFPAQLYASLADRVGGLLGTKNDVLIVQGEAIIALEAAAHSLARPGLSALNIVTSPYGALFGTWLGRGGARVENLVAAPGLPIDLDAVKAQWESRGPFDLVALVHAESASGILNPLEEITALAKANGALVVVDAVASIGGHALAVDELDIDIAVIGPQKSLGGSAGLSAISVSPRAWEAILREDTIYDSILSLADHKHNWIEKGRGALPGMPSSLEAWALKAALDAIENEGINSVINRHKKASQASHAALPALGLSSWIAPEKASALITAAALPGELHASTVLAFSDDPIALSKGVGSIAERIIRINHTGPRANEATVLATLSKLGKALNAAGFSADTATALDIASDIYAQN